MSVNEKMVQDIVQEVVAKMQISSDVAGKKGVFSDMNEAIEASKKTQKIVARMSMTRERRSFPTSDRKSDKMLRSLPAWELRRLAWEMSDIKF